MVFFKPPVSAQSVVKSKAYYDAITYTWSGDDGIPVTSKLTDKATDPHQIIALLEKVYGDPRVPGPYYSAYGDWNKSGRYYSYNEGRCDEVYYGSVTTNGWNVTATRPNEEGYTVLLVAVKNSFTPDLSNPRYASSITNYRDLVSYIGSSIDFVQLMTDGMRVGSGENAGTLFPVQGTFNRFFFLGKGQARKQKYANKIMVPFLNMFEQFSPTDGQTGDNTQDLTDFYDKMVKGETYPVMHDCNSVMEVAHYFSMSGRKGTTSYDMTGLNFFVPDYRLLWWGKTNTGWFNDKITSYTDNRDMNESSSDAYAQYGFYNTSHTPWTFLYTIKLRAQADQEGAQADHKYKVTLNWTSSIDELAGEKIDQVYDLYRVVDGVVEPTPIATGLTTTTWSEIVDQRTSGYSLDYVVKGKPVKATYNPVQSNVATVAIPGYDPLERLKLTIDGDYRSTYDASTEVNNYANTIMMNNGVGTSVMREHLMANPAFQVLRYGSDGSMLTVATLQISGVNSTSSRCNYTLHYDNQSVAKSDNTGYFTFNSNGEIQFNDFKMVDDFSADVSANEHPSKYHYQVKFTSAVAVKDENGDDKTEIYSNIVDVPVYKAETNLIDCYDKPTVDADIYRPDNEKVVIPEKDANPMGLRFNVVDNPNIFRYYTTRDDDEYGHAQRMTDGSYVVSSLQPGETVKSHVETVSFATGENSKHVNVRDYAINGLDYNPTDVVTYNTVIESFLPHSSSTDHNTYGSCKQVSKIVDLQAECVDRMKSNDIFTDASGVEGRYYLSQLEITPIIPEGFKIYKLRVWRKTADGVAMEVKDEYKWRLDQVAKPLEIDFDESGEILSWNFNTLKGQEPKWAGGSLIVNDYFGAVNQELNTTYYVRAYLCYPDGMSINGRKRAAAAGDSNHYLADQASLEVKFDSRVVTGIDGVSNARQVQRVTYVNALGMQSDTPFSGVNVVVTTYSDGSVTKVKKVMK